MSNSKKLSEMQKNIGGGKKLTNASKYMDVNLFAIVDEVKKEIEESQKFKGIKLIHEKTIHLSYIVSCLKNNFPNENWYYKFKDSCLKPDGGILYIYDNKKNKYPILISEVKRQGTNDEIIIRTGKSQAKGNAIERLGKNVIGFRTWMKSESIFPFICFGSGCDFSDDSSILDRVITIAEFGELNKISVHDTENTKRGSFYFRHFPFKASEIKIKVKDICEKSIFYYYSKYGEESFICDKSSLITKK